MILRFLLALLGWIWVWYGVAHLRYWNTETIATLRNEHRTLIDEHEQLSNQYTQLSAAQELIKVKAKELVKQNEDYSKIISQLNRYYYQLQSLRETLQWVYEKLGPADDAFESKLERIQATSPMSPPEFKESSSDQQTQTLQR